MRENKRAIEREIERAIEREIEGIEPKVIKTWFFEVSCRQSSVENMIPQL